MDSGNQNWNSEETGSGSTASSMETREFSTIDRDASSAGSPSSSRSSNKGTNSKTNPKKSAGQDTIQQAQDTASQVASQAQDTAGKVIDQVKETAASKLEDQKSKAAQGVASVASAVQEAGRNLDDDSPIADYAERAAFYLDRFSTYLQQRDLRSLVTEVEHFARRQPALYVGGGLLLGLLGARFLKSSSSEAQSGTQTRTQNYYAGTTGSTYGNSGSSSGSGSGLETFTTRGNYTTEGIENTGQGDSGEQTIHSYYRVESNGTDNTEV